MPQRRPRRFPFSRFQLGLAGAAALTLLAACFPPNGSNPEASNAERAEALFSNGTIHLDTTQSTEALAVSGGKVVAIGAEALARVGPDTLKVDLKGAHAYPGFTDSHMHLLAGSFGVSQLQLLDGDQPLGTMDATKTKLATYMEEHPGTGWIVGMGWRMTAGNTPDGRALDAITGDRPVFLVDLSGHSALVNSKGMELAGIDANTTAPAGGEIVKDGGVPTGWIKESAMSLVSDVLIPTLSDAQIGGALPQFLTLAASGGLTGASEILGAPGLNLSRPQIFTQLDQQGKLPVRIHYYVPVFKPQDVAAAAALGREHKSDRVRFAGGKIWIDGAMGNGDSWTKFGHVDAPDEHGSHYFDGSTLKAILEQAESHQMPMQLHINGDAAMDQALEALESVKAAQGSLRQAHTLVHLGFVEPTQIDRMKKLNVIISAQPGFWGSTADTTKAAYGHHFNGAYNYKALIEAGLALSIGTDWPVSPSPFPLNVMAVGSQPPQNDRRPLTVAEMIRSYTEGSAASVLRTDLGSLTIGKIADLVVFSADPQTATGPALEQIKVKSTYLGGKPAYVAP